MVHFEIKLSTSLFLCVSAALSLSLIPSPDRKFLSVEENRKLNKTCGKPPSGSRSKRALFGKELEVGDAPWAASITYSQDWYPEIPNSRREESEGLRCGATLISPRHVVTTAQCFGVAEADCTRSLPIEMKYRNLARFRVYLGGTCSHPASCRELKRDDRLVMRSVTRAFIPSFFTGDLCSKKKGETPGDIAVLELDEDVKFTENVYPACIHNEDAFEKWNSSNGTGIVAGFGRDFAQEPPVPPITILKQYTHKRMTKCPEVDDIFCSVAEFGALCGGDIGSGFVSRIDGRVSLLGNLFMNANCKQVMKYRDMGEATEWAFNKKDTSMIEMNQFTRVNSYTSFICQAAGVCLKEDFERLERIRKLPPTSRPSLVAEIDQLQYQEMFV